MYFLAKVGFDTASRTSPLKPDEMTRGRGPDADPEWESKNFYFQPEAWRNNKLDEVTETTGRAI